MAKQIVNKESVIVPVGTMEDFKRPDHPDFHTSSELAKNQWSGIRHNSVTNDAEIWLLGEMMVAISPEQVNLNMHAIDEAYAEIFGLHEVRPYDPALIAYRHQRDKAKEEKK